MVTVKQLMDRLSEFNPEDEVTIDASNHDGSAWASIRVGKYQTEITDMVDYYNSCEIQLI